MPTPAYRYESPDQREDYEEIQPDGSIVLHFPKDPTFLLPDQLPAVIIEEFRDKIASSYGDPHQAVEFPDGSQGTRVRNGPWGNEVRITFKNDRVIEKATYKYPEGRKMGTEIIHLAGQGVL